MSDIIQLLPDHVANQIAAGEVVQRPASVVKELLENAIDAESTFIKLIIKESGKTLIQVIDNGKGMSVTDARLSFERHATSKIRSAEDLFDIHTKGFRGEALASIAAVAHFELKTKQVHDELGTQIDIQGSEIKTQDVIVTPNGTSVAIKNLFFNIPARRNFLKSNNVELRHILDEFHRVALAHPNIGFSMHHNGNELYNLPICNYRQRIVKIFGSKTNEKLVPVDETTEVLKVSGFVMKPEFAKKTRGEQFFFVNDRFIKSSYLNHAVNAAFEGLLREKTHASYFLFLEVDPKTIDVNIHPTKTEIKFEDEHTLYAILRSAVKHSLGQFSVAPVLDFDRDSNLDTPYNYAHKAVKTPMVEVDRTFNPFEEEERKPVSKIGASDFKGSSKGTSWESLYVDTKIETPSETVFSSVAFETDTVTSSMFDDDDQDLKQNTFQLHKKYIINTIKSGMLVINQQRAHERILYEDFLKNITVKEGVSQQLLFPICVDFSPKELDVLRSLKSHLIQTGFVFSKIEGHLEIVGVPANLEEANIPEVLEQLVYDAQYEVSDQSFSQSDMIAKSLAKSMAIKTGRKLTEQEQDHMIHSLFGCKEPNVTPCGKATFVTMRVDDLDKKFN
ncbi:MAG: DNA mismatch repair endonuclease MutL [Flavobacteriaceae bacterium]|nr:DNA mismatch repair endonuclease MutL [Flavobacteriaceae bacterium]